MGFMIKRDTKVSKRCFRKRNKAGYTAISYGRMGRGGNALFPPFRLDHYGPTDGPMDRRTDKASYRVACPQLKIHSLDNPGAGFVECLDVFFVFKLVNVGMT